MEGEKFGPAIWATREIAVPYIGWKPTYVFDNTLVTDSEGKNKSDAKTLTSRTLVKKADGILNAEFRGIDYSGKRFRKKGAHEFADVELVEKAGMSWIDKFPSEFVFRMRFDSQTYVRKLLPIAALDLPAPSIDLDSVVGMTETLFQKGLAKIPDVGSATATSKLRRYFQSLERYDGSGHFEFPAEIAHGIHPLIAGIETDWDKGKVYELKIYIDRALTEEETRKLLKIKKPLVSFTSLADGNRTIIRMR